jgi:DNA-directed RNA polymerase subunit RPC12/RpoP
MIPQDAGADSGTAYLFDFATACLDGCGAQLLVPVREIVRDRGTYRCSHCGHTYTLSPEQLRDLAGLLDQSEQVP